jgi:DASH complex subunit DAM1
MSSSTPIQHQNKASSRPTTPLRSASRSSTREAKINGLSADFPLNALEGQFSELAESMADLEANFMHLQLMQESLAHFSESFASFLYGLNMNAFCADFPEVHIIAHVDCALT